MKKIVLFIFFCSSSAFVISQKTEITLLIDPGHGGKDPGHLSGFEGIAQEKEITLEIANKVGNYLLFNLSHVKVLYTRTSDEYPTLDERVEIANSKNVDYMLSIHVNGNSNENVHGTESHIHNFDAKKSYAWALLIEEQFKTRAGRKSRGVKTVDDLGHSLQILKFTKMPTVLVECGFITNSSEAKFLNSVYGQEIIASAIFRATRAMLKTNHPEIDFTPTTDLIAETKEEPYYKVQIMASIDSISTNINEFKKLEYPVERTMLESSSMYKYKYYLGPFTDKKEAKKAQKHAQETGFPDAFLIFYEK